MEVFNVAEVAAIDVIQKNQHHSKKKNKLEFPQ